MFTTQTEWQSSSTTEPGEFEWQVVQRSLMWPWLIVQVVGQDVVDPSDVLLDDVECLLHLCRTEPFGTVLDVHMVLPPPWPWDGQMRVIRVTSMSITTPRAQGGAERGVLKTELGEHFVGKMLEPLKRAPPRLVRLKEFPDIKTLRELYGLSEEEPAADPKKGRAW